MTLQCLLESSLGIVIALLGQQRQSQRVVGLGNTEAVCWLPAQQRQRPPRHGGTFHALAVVGIGSRQQVEQARGFVEVLVATSGGQRFGGLQHHRVGTTQITRIAVGQADHALQACLYFRRCVQLLVDARCCPIQHFACTDVLTAAHAFLTWIGRLEHFHEEPADLLGDRCLALGGGAFGGQAPHKPGCKQQHQQQQGSPLPVASQPTPTAIEPATIACLHRPMLQIAPHVRGHRLHRRIALPGRQGPRPHHDGVQITAQGSRPATIASCQPAGRRHRGSAVTCAAPAALACQQLAQYRSQAEDITADTHQAA